MKFYQKAVIWIMIASFLALVVFVIWLAWTGYRSDITGFGEYEHREYQEAKTLWDWMDLLIIPIVLAIGGFLFGLAQRKSVEKIELNRYREASLQAYLDKITKLMIEKKLIRPKEEEENDANETIRSITNVRTITLLRTLDGFRKGIIIHFLYAADLIKGEQPVIKLSSADLAGVDLRGINLSEINLKEANLSRADLRFCDLTGTHLRGAILRGADLRRITSLENADMSSTHLEDADLRGTDLSEANLTNSHYNKRTRSDIPLSDLLGKNRDRTKKTGNNA